MADHQENKKKISRMTLILLNIVLVALILFICLRHVNHHQKDTVEAAEESFVSNVSSMGVVADSVLQAEQNACRDWAVYINGDEDMTMEEAVEYLNASNSVDEIMAHVLDYETYTGFTSTDGSAVSYAGFADAVKNQAEIVRNGEVDDHAVVMTAAYTNPVTTFQAVGFLENITLSDKDYLLVRVVPVSYIQNKWVFPGQYQNAEMSLIAGDGSYIVRSSSMKSSNLWEFVRSYNNTGYDGIEKIKNAYYSGETKISKILDSAGKENYLAVLPYEENREDLYFAAMIPAEDLENVEIDFSLVMIVALGMLAILLLNSMYILDMNRQLRISNQAANEASRAKTDFLSSMSHDIRTPMNAIIGLTNIASKNVNDPDRVEDCLNKISLAGNHLLTLINDILDISKIESGKLTLNPAEFSLADLVSEQMNIVQSQIRAKNQELEIHLDGVKHEKLYADELRLNQVFINLLSNAVKYTDEGGRISVNIKEEPVDEEGKQVKLTYAVKDTGVGISPEFMKVMFEPFSRMKDSRTDQTQGTGLGLAITKQMVDLMGGKIFCESEVGKGSTFTVELTLDTRDNGMELKLPEMDVLLADDDQVFLDTSKDTIDSLGLKGDYASSGHEAVEKVLERHTKKEDYDVVLLDWKMPDLSGLSVLKEIRKEAGEDVPIIIVTAYDWTDIEDEAREAGVTGFLSKPLFRSTLYAKLHDVMHLSEKGEEAPESEDIAAGLRGMKFLVAEDNDINWEIIRELLHMYEISSERAENGQIAVDMLADRDYDAVLMDIQMPVMNGYESARAIRKLEDEKKRNIPIIAMTADAFAEDIQMCLDAGMNAHTAKPVNMKKLFDAVRSSMQ